MIVHVDKILVGGEALAHGDEGSVLLANGVPSDQLEVECIQKRRGMHRAVIKKVQHASPIRIHPACQHAETCGGCALQYVAPSEHAMIKSAWVHDAFQSCLSVHTLWQPIVEEAQFGRRRRIRFWHAEGKLGLRRRTSHQQVQLEHCLICEPRLEELRVLLQGQLPVQVQSVQMCLLADGVHVILESHQSCPEISMIWPEDVQPWWRKKQHTIPLSEQVMPLHDWVDGLLIRVGPDDFIQNDAVGNQALLAQLKTWSEGASFIVDLFSGVGNLSLPLAQNARVLGAELHISSVKAASSNAKRLGLDAQYRVLNLFESVPLYDFAGADVLILDPPRRGAKEVCQQLGSLMPKKIIMVSCDIASGARDGQIIQQAGYVLKELKALDLFPYAGHVEALSLWERA